MEPLPELFWRLHAGLPKQGPGSDASTLRALASAGPLPPAPRILDLGCGPGRQTLALARATGAPGAPGATGGRVTAVDRERRLLDELRRRAADAGLAERIETLERSFEALDLEPHAWDLVWSEGAIYTLGFEAGLDAWRRYVRPGGVLAVSEAAWLTRTPPERARAFWERAYPALRHREDLERRVVELGFELLESFVLPDADWTAGYYDELEPRLARLRAEVGPEEVALLDEEAEEIALFRAREGSYGYVFLVLRPAGA